LRPSRFLEDQPAGWAPQRADLVYGWRSHRSIADSAVERGLCRCGDRRARAADSWAAVFFPHSAGETGNSGKSKRRASSFDTASGPASHKVGLGCVLASRSGGGCWIADCFAVKRVLAHKRCLDESFSPFFSEPPPVLQDSGFGHMTAADRTSRSSRRRSTCPH